MISILKKHKAQKLFLNSSESGPSSGENPSSEGPSNDKEATQKLIEQVAALKEQIVMLSDKVESLRPKTAAEKMASMQDAGKKLGATTASKAKGIWAKMGDFKKKISGAAKEVLVESRDGAAKSFDSLKNGTVQFAQDTIQNSELVGLAKNGAEKAKATFDGVKNVYDGASSAVQGSIRDIGMEINTGVDAASKSFDTISASAADNLTATADDAGKRIAASNQLDRSMESAKGELSDQATLKKAMNTPLNKLVKDLIKIKLGDNPIFSGGNVPEFNTMSELQGLLTLDGLDQAEIRAIQEIVEVVLSNASLNVVDKIGVGVQKAVLEAKQAVNKAGQASDGLIRTLNQNAADAINKRPSLDDLRRFFQRDPNSK